LRPRTDVSRFEGDDLRLSVCVGRPVLKVPDVIVPFGVLDKSSIVLLGPGAPPSSRKPASLDRRDPLDRALLFSPFVVVPCGRLTRSSLADGSESPNLPLDGLGAVVSAGFARGSGFGTAPYVLIPPILKVRRARQEEHGCCMLIMLN